MCEEVTVSLGTEFTAALNHGAVSKEGDMDAESAMDNTCPLWAIEFCCTVGGNSWCGPHDRVQPP